MGEKDELQLKDMEKGDVDNSTEKSPLKEADGDEGGKDGEGKENGIKEIKSNGGLTSLLNDPKNRFLLISLALFLILLLIVSAAIAVLLVLNRPEPEVWIEDSVPRMLRLIPTPNGPKNMLRFRSGHGSEGRIWPNLTEEITNLLHVYDPSVQRTNVTNCGSRATPPPDEKLTCFYNTEEIRQLCRVEDNYGYAEGSPCIFIQFNHVANFTPEVYTKQDLDNDSLPQSLRNTYQFKGPWVECSGNEVIDVENAGEIKIAPGREWPRHAFPYRGHSDYMSPFLAIKLSKPQTGVAISMTCRLWARNVVYNATESGLNDTMVGEDIVPSAILPFNLFIE